MSRIIDEEGRREFPFPHMDTPRTASSSGSSSLPSRSDSSQTKSLRSSASSALSRNSIRRTRLERDQHDGFLPGAPTKFLSHLMSPPHQDSRSLRSTLAVTTEKLANEKMRADSAEQRVLDVLRKLRAAHEATMLAQAEASRAREELTLYKYRLEDAKREISRAQELLNELEQQKLEAEAEAARARSTARRYREQQLIARAREEGRQEGFQEGFSRGKDLGFQDAVVDEPRDRRYGVMTVEEVPEEEEEERSPAPQYRSQTPGPAEIRVRTPAPEFRIQTPGPTTISSGRVTPPLQPRRPPSRFSTSQTGHRTHVPDTAHHAPTLPVPTIVTPFNGPSPSHSRADTPTGIPVPHPGPRSLDDGEISTPIPIAEPTPSPVHPPVDIPPDGYIPYADQNAEIYMPPPHELSRPLSPTPIPAPAIHPVLPPPSHPSTSSASEPEIRSRDYAYAAGMPPEGIPVTRSNASRPMSPQSKASTNISQFDLVGAPKSRLRVSTTGRPSREDRQVMSPRGPRPREDLPVPSVLPPPLEREEDSAASARPSAHTDRVQSPVSTSPLEKLFKRKFRSKSKGRDRDATPVIPPPPIPDIVIESPSTPSTSRSSVKTTITHPHLLSPEQHSVQSLAPQDEIIVMRTEIPDYHPSNLTAQWNLTSDSPIQFPPGFVPLTPPVQTGSLSANAIPVPSNTPVPIPSNAPIPVPSNTPVPIPPPGHPLPIPMHSAIPVQPNDPTLPVLSQEAIPIPHDNPLPIPHNSPLPIPSPRQQRYDEAPLPAGVVYPEPLSRRSGTPRTIGSPASLRRARLDVRSPGSRLSPLPLSFQIFAPLRSETTTASVES